ncbi:hypothetical protein B5E41_15120 [Rhizobium esperanzae]|uniref:Uncharacterized protein n=2 Tax=Rhizobium esperanzae TaxID=1967781 RepID=A0A246DUI0_9HYPH|nr:hypothetical protein B5E41_15120 [Rhizobium esperanzae]
MASFDRQRRCHINDEAPIRPRLPAGTRHAFGHPGRRRTFRDRGRAAARKTILDHIMADVIEVDFHLVWQYPVFIRTAEREEKRIEGPDAALDVLNHPLLPVSLPEAREARHAARNSWSVR